MGDSVRRGVVSYQTGWMANSLSWSYASHDPTALRFAATSYLRQYVNFVDVAAMRGSTMVCHATVAHSYPPTKVLFAPERPNSADLLVTTGDYLRLWEVVEAVEAEGPATDAVDPVTPPSEAQAAKAAECPATLKLRHTFDQVNKANDFCSPLTSCDWSVDEPHTVGCCSIDTTVNIWDIEKSKSVAQLIAHDKEVYDMAFARHTHSFASCGGDGSVRMFDMREMEHCSIVFEARQPLMRLSWNKVDGSFLATVGTHSNEVVVLDVRMPTHPVCSLKGEDGSPINGLCWAPHSSSHLCTAGEDCYVTIWDLSDGAPQSILTYHAGHPVNGVIWCDSEYLAATCGTAVQVLHV